jgi:mannosyltransferase
VTVAALPTRAPTSRPPDASATRWTPLELLPPLLVLILGSALLLPGHGLWFDELFTAEVARLPLGAILTAIADGTGTTSYLAGVPPSYNAPYYLVVHAWMSLPGLGGDTSLRALSLIATAGGLASITRAVARLGGRRPAATGWRSWPPAEPRSAWSGGCRRAAACCSSASPEPGWAWRTGTR